MTDFKNFRYSIVIPAYNAEKTIRKAIDSCLNQTIKAEKIIVVDDGSTDQTAAIVRSMAGDQLKLYQTANGGVACARNLGISVVNTPWVAMLDADDYWETNKIDVQQRSLHAAGGQIACIFSDFSAFGESGALISQSYIERYFSAWHDELAVNAIEKKAALEILNNDQPIQIERLGLQKALFFGNLVLTSTSVFNTSLLLKAGGYARDFTSGGEDYDMYTRLAMLGDFLYVKSSLTCYSRETPKSLSKNSVGMATANLRTLERMLSDSAFAQTIGTNQIAARRFSAMKWLVSAHFYANELSLARKLYVKNLLSLLADAEGQKLGLRLLVPAAIAQSIRNWRHRKATSK